MADLPDRTAAPHAAPPASTEPAPLPAPGPAALLPAGFHDTLPPEAGHEAAAVERLMAILGGHGYDRVKPPLAEFEETLLAGPGAGLARDSFRVMDPVSQRMLAVRADMTPQIARIAGSRLVNAPRPLRLAYAGQVLRVRGSQLRPERQFAQVGAELIGADAAAADVEAAVLAAGALAEIGVDRLSLDLNLPTLVPALLDAWGIAGAPAGDLRHALDRKDSAQVEAAGGRAAPLLAALMAATGPADSAIETAARLDLPSDAARAAFDRLVAVVEGVRATLPDLALTVDFVEHRGFEYQTGVSFTLFARGVRGELGRGGRYTAGGAGPDTATEPATGFTLFMDSVLRALPAPSAPRRIYLPAGTPPALAAHLRAQGWDTVAGLAPVADDAAEARRLGCAAVVEDDAARPL
jgi:ATP phosphoribosyltransferase regulatory subunit